MLSATHISGSRSLEKDEMQKFWNEGFPCEESKDEGENENVDDVSNENSELKNLELLKNRKRKLSLSDKIENIPGVETTELSNDKNKLSLSLSQQMAVNQVNPSKNTKVRLANMAVRGSKEEGENENVDDVSNENSELTNLELLKNRKRKLSLSRSGKKILYKTDKVENIPGVETTELSNDENKLSLSLSQQMAVNQVNPSKNTKVRLANMAKLTNNNDSHCPANIVEDAQMVTIRKEREDEYCMSLFEGEECTVEDCSSSHILDPITARDYLDTVAQKCEANERPEKILSFWRFHSKKSVSTGAAIVSRLTEMCSNGRLAIDLKGYSEMVTWIHRFPQYYTVTNKNSYMHMKELLEGTARIVEKGNNRQRGKEVSTIINWAWEKIYLDSSSNGIVMQQEVLENICTLLKATGLFCSLSELLYISSMSPTLYVPMDFLSSLLSQLPSNVSSISNVINCQCGNSHTIESSISLAKIITRLPFTDLSNLNNRLEHLTSKLDSLVTLVKDDMDGEDFGRFVRRIEDLDTGISLPEVSVIHDGTKNLLRKNIKEENWKDVARFLVTTENCYIDILVEYVEELYGVITELPENMAAMVFENLRMEFERLQYSELQKELFCQLGLSLIIKFLASGHILETVGILYTIVRSDVDLSRLKPLVVFDLEFLVENESSLSVPVFVIDLCLEIDNVELATCLIHRWKYLAGHPKVRYFNDLEHQRKMFEKILEKTLTSAKPYHLKTYVICLRIFEILCGNVAVGWPWEKKDKMTEYGKIIMINLLNGGMTGLDLWGAAVTANRCLNVVVDEVARGVVVRLVQANMVKEARTVYNWPGGPYEMQDPDPNKKGQICCFISSIQSFYSSEELEVILIDYLFKLKNANYDGAAGVGIEVLESPTIPCRINCLEQENVTQVKAIVRIQQVLARMEPSLPLKNNSMWYFIPPQFILKYLSQNLKSEY